MWWTLYGYWTGSARILREQWLSRTLHEGRGSGRTVEGESNGWSVGAGGGECFVAGALNHVARSIAAVRDDIPVTSAFKDFPVGVLSRH